MRVYETVIYAGDSVAAAAFYRDALGLRAIAPPGERAAAFRLDDGGVLLIFEPDTSSAPGRFVPSHGTTGEGHVAFSVEPGETDALRPRLESLGIEIEREITWPLGGRSVYIRDPAGNSVELIEGEAWEA
jgi:catechol 2,3-dioxygenase-like lactoylglutathione lyase family enzyme